MRIVAVTSHDILKDFSGTPKHILKIVSEIANRGHQILVLHLKFCSNYQLVKHDYAQGITVYEIPFLRWFSSSLQLIKEFQAEACMAFTNGAACRLLPVLATHNLPLLYEVHTVFKNNSILSPIPFIYEQLEKLVCCYAQHLVVLGEKVKEIYAESRQVDRQKISVIYPSVDIAEFTLTPEQKNKKNLNVTYLGNLIYTNHGINFLLDAAKIVCAKTDEINFVFAGQPENAEQYYHPYVSELKDRVKFVCLQDANQVNDVMSNSDILAHTRINSLDNLSVQSKLAVYLATGKPIVATNFADYQYLIQERGCGYAVDLNPECIAEAILKLGKNPELRQKMGAHSRETASMYFNLETTINKYIHILESIG